MRFLLPLLLAASAIGADVEPESAHKAFKARAAMEAQMRLELAGKPPGTAVPSSAKMDALALASNLAEADAINDWLGVSAHIPNPPNDASHHQLWMLCSIARGSVAAKTWPCWVAKEEKDMAKLHDLYELGAKAAEFQGPDWFDDLCDGGHKGTHRTN